MPRTLLYPQRPAITCPPGSLNNLFTVREGQAFVPNFLIVTNYDESCRRVVFPPRTKVTGRDLTPEFYSCLVLLRVLSVGGFGYLWPATRY
jgi:hypothetical protein